MIKVCKNCGDEFPSSVIIDGERRNLQKRRYCLECSPFGAHNTKILERTRTYRKCIQCGQKLERTQKKYCNIDCQKKYQWERIKEEIRLSRFISDGRRSTARKFFVEEYGHQCQICGNTEWNGKPIPLTLDHIDGNCDNGDLDNLRIVCPNCDAQLPTYKGANKGNGRKYRRKKKQG